MMHGTMKIKFSDNENECKFAWNYLYLSHENND